MEPLISFWYELQETVKDVFPIMILLLFFQLVILRKPLPNLKRLVLGFVFVLVGLTLFLNGLETALFPVGRIMAKQLSDPQFVFGSMVIPPDSGWFSYIWIYIFGALIGFAATIAEPSLIAVSYKAHEVSRGALNQWSLRLAVALGVGLGIGIGTFRIVTGTPLYIYIIAGYVIVVIQTIFAPREIVPLAYDSGGVTTSSVTVPLITALGLGLAETVPGRNPALDGFGLIAFASVFPIITVMGYAQISRWQGMRDLRKTRKE
jgi:hypothetical protein